MSRLRNTLAAAVAVVGTGLAGCGQVVESAKGGVTGAYASITGGGSFTVKPEVQTAQSYTANYLDSKGAPSQEVQIGQGDTMTGSVSIDGREQDGLVEITVKRDDKKFVYVSSVDTVRAIFEDYIRQGVLTPESNVVKELNKFEAKQAEKAAAAPAPAP